MCCFEPTSGKHDILRGLLNSALLISLNCYGCYKEYDFPGPPINVEHLLESCSIAGAPLCPCLLCLVCFFCLGLKKCIATNSAIFCKVARRFMCLHVYRAIITCHPPNTKVVIALARPPRPPPESCRDGGRYFTRFLFWLPSLMVPTRCSFGTTCSKL